MTVHGKRAHLTRTFFSRFFIRAGCSETALQNDAICSDVTRSTRALYAQIARVAVERVIHVQSLLPVKFRMRFSTRMRITLSVSPRLLFTRVRAPRISPCHARFAQRRSRERDAGLRSVKSVEGSLPSRKVSSMIVLWHSIAFETRALKCKTLGGIHMQSTAAMHIH